MSLNIAIWASGNGSNAENIIKYFKDKTDIANIRVKSSGLANPSLCWETSVQTDLGVDLGFFNNKLTATIDWYSKRTEGMLMTQPIPSYVGENKPMGNVGIMSNRGIELELGYKFSDMREVSMVRIMPDTPRPETSAQSEPAAPLD